MEGKISALCCNGAENVFSANNAGPRARATDPTRLDVSTAKMSGSSMIAYPYVLALQPFVRNAHNLLFPVVPNSPGGQETLYFAIVMLDFIDQISCGAIFLLQKIAHFNTLQGRLGPTTFAWRYQISSGCGRFFLKRVMILLAGG
jgi:hypothetical protein